VMATKEREFRPLPDNLSLEELVPKDNFYRRLEQRLDLSFVRELVADRYAAAGRHSVDPVVFFRLELVMFFEGIRSERELMKIASDRLSSLRWYLGYDLHEPLPDHSSLTRIRERYGLEIFRGFFERIVEMCVEAGLVRGEEELFFDSTKVKANVDIDSLAWRFLVETHLNGLFEGAAIPEGSEVRPSVGTGLDALPTSEDERMTAANARKSDWISRAGKQDRSFSSGPRKRTSDLRVSRTDPDATPMLIGEREAKLGYQTHYDVVDGGKARIIIAALVTPYEVSENRPMLDLLWRSCFRWRFRPHHVTADGKYGTPPRTSGPSSRRTSERLWRCTGAGAGPTSWARRTSPTTPKRTSRSAQPESSWGLWVRRTAKQIARGRSPPTAPRAHLAKRAS
jgi:transposase